jgi:hypothetical protein
VIGRRRRRGIRVKRNMLRGRPRRRQRKPRRRPRSKQLLNSSKTMEERLVKIVAAAAAAMTRVTAATIAALVVLVTRVVTMAKEVGVGKNVIASVNI